MSWPQSFNITTLNIGKNSYLPNLLAWGTEGSYTSVIVRNIRSTPMIEEIKIEQGGGLTATQVLLNDGDEVEFTVIDDRAITWPLTGTTVSLINPQPNGTSGTPEVFMTVNNNYNVAAKSAGERTIIAKRFVLFVPTNM